MSLNKEKKIFENSKSLKYSENKAIYDWIILSALEHPNLIKALNERSDIFDYNKKLFLSKFGKQDFQINNGYRYYYWKFNLKDSGTFWLSTAKDEGTIIYIDINKDKEYEFFELFKDKIRSIFNITTF